MKFRKKPVVIEARRYTGDNYEAIDDWMTGGFWNLEDDGRLAIKTLEGVIYASPGDWIIRGVNGEYYPCKPDIFEKTYEPVEE